MRWRAALAQEAHRSRAAARHEFNRFLVTAGLLAACLVMLPLVACGPSDDTAEDPSAALWAEVEQMQAELAATRAELEEARAQLEASAEGAADEAAEAAEATEVAAEEAAGEAAEAAPTPEELEAKIEELEEEARSQAEAFTTKLIEYINASGIVEGQPLTTEQRQAFDWKAEEDIRIAQEYIDEGGDYSRAIDIYNASLMADPENQALLDAKAEAERLQFMTEERFAAVEQGMTQEEVREAIGTVNYRNVREYEEENRLGWFYRREDGGAAGVFFKKRGEDWVVELADYNAAKPPTAEGEESE